MFEDVDALPGTQHRRTVDDRDGKVSLGQRRAYVGRHIVRPFEDVFVNRVAFGHQPGQEAFEIALYGRVVIFLYQETRRGMPDVERQQAAFDRARAHTSPDVVGAGIESLPAGRNGDGVDDLAHGGHFSFATLAAMLLLVPHLFPSQRLLDVAAANLRLPALQTLLARGTRRREPAEGIGGAVCKALGIARQQDWPLAPLALEAEGEAAGDSYWLRADPVHLRVMRDRIVLFAGDEIRLAQDEADALSAAVAAHFGGELSPRPVRPHHWYVRLARPPALTTTALSAAIGRHVDPLLPEGRDAMRFRSYLNEVQMLLHEHPVNLRREARGEPAINSLWLWGGGTRPVPVAGPLPALWADAAEARAAGSFCGAQLHPTPERFETTLLGGEDVMLLDALVPSGQYGDAQGWREALGRLETDWFAPLLAALRTSPARRVQVCDPVSGKGLDLRALDLWQVWRRSRPLASLLGEP